MGYRFKCAAGIIMSFCCFLFVLSGTAFSQDTERIVIPSETEGGDFDFILDENKDLKKELRESDLNRVTLQQMGHMNEAYIQQFSEGKANLVKVTQDGNSNYIDLTQTGTVNATDIQQHKDGNTYLGSHKGNSITNTVIQDGYNNYIEQQLEADFLDLKIEQFGNGHVLYQKEAQGGIGYKVTQTGTEGMKISISQGNIYK